MSKRVLAAIVVLLSVFVLEAPASLRAASERTSKLSGLLDGSSTVTLTLEAPLKKLFAKSDPHASRDDRTFVAGRVVYKDPDTGAEVALSDVEVSVRGHTSRNEEECTFPKLKIRARPGGALRIGTHCGESPDDTLSPKYGRLSNEKSPFREALTYKILYALNVPTLRTRPARITYVDPDADGARLTRNALLIEDENEAMTRVGGTAPIGLETFGNVKSRHAEADGARIAFGEAAIANFDWCLKFTPDDIYRCNDPKPLWNILAFDRGRAPTALLMEDFDLAGTVVGHHPWFRTVFNASFVPSKSETDAEVIAQVQRARSLFTRGELDALRADLLRRKPAAYRAVDTTDVDPTGRELARAHLDAFYRAISDEGFYIPVVGHTDVQVYRDAARSAEACGSNDTLRVGTPVKSVQQSGSMSQVVILDALWRWSGKSACSAVVNGPVWIQSDAITSRFPPNEAPGLRSDHR
jgi:hypothetical protein